MAYQGPSNYTGMGGGGTSKGVKAKKSIPGFDQTTTFVDTEYANGLMTQRATTKQKSTTVSNADSVITKFNTPI